MLNRLMCKFLGLHNYEYIKEEKISDAHGNIIGKVMISRCVICGKIKHYNYYTEHNNGGYN